MLLSTTLVATALLSLQGSFSCSEEDRRLLRELVGNYEVEGIWRVAPDDYADTRGTADVRSTLGGCALIETLRIQFRGQTLEVLTITRVKEDQSISRIRMDSEHDGQMELGGHGTDSSMEFSWERQFDERVMTISHRVVDIQANHFMFISEMRTSQEAEPVTTARLLYERR